MLGHSGRNLRGTARHIPVRSYRVSQTLVSNQHVTARIQYKKAIPASEWMQYYPLRIALQRCGTHSR